MRHGRLDPCRARNAEAPLATFLQNWSFDYFGSLCAPEPTYIDPVNRVFTPTQEEVDFWGELVALQTRYDHGIKIDGKWCVRNKSKWGILRIQLAAHFGIHPNIANRRMKVEQVGGIVVPAEAESIGDQGRALV